MKALWIESPGVAVYGDVPEPVPQAGWVRLKVLAASVCGSDKSVFQKGRIYDVDRRISGHEFVGVIDQLGEGVQNRKIGQRVCVFPQLYCGECEECAAGHINTCEHRQFIGGKDYDGGFAEYVVVPEYTLIDVPDSVSDIEAAMAEPFGVGLRAVNRAGGKELKGKTVVINGTSPIGLFAMESAKYYGASTIIMLGRVPEKLAIAKEHGATAVINSRGKSPEELRDEVMELTGGRGADAVIDAICLDITIESCMYFCMPHGIVSVVGLKKEICPLNFRYLIRNEITITGAYTYTTEIRDSIHMLAEGKINTEYIANPVAPLRDGPMILREITKNPDSYLKAVLIPDID